jgi:ribosomal protein S18 acetylase RimI-like enzyme
MSGPRGLVLGDGRLRMVPWRGDTTTAYLTPARGRPSVGAVSRCLEQLHDEGFLAVLTAALAAPEQAPFLAAGFAVHERLHLLTRSLDDLPPEPRVDQVLLRRGRRAARPAVLEVDNAAFPPFWRLDESGLDDAMTATPSSRLRVAVGPADAIVGYAVTGRAGPRGYLQRLAVRPNAQHQGVGSMLVIDGLRWLRRWGAREVMVNTQEGNEPAVRLYQRLGFRLEADGLAVLHRSVGSTS